MTGSVPCSGSRFKEKSHIKNANAIAGQAASSSPSSGTKCQFRRMAKAGTRRRSSTVVKLIQRQLDDVMALGLCTEIRLAGRGGEQSGLHPYASSIIFIALR